MFNSMRSKQYHRNLQLCTFLPSRVSQVMTCIYFMLSSIEYYPQDFYKKIFVELSSKFSFHFNKSHRNTGLQKLNVTHQPFKLQGHFVVFAPKELPALKGWTKIIRDNKSARRCKKQCKLPIERLKSMYSPFFNEIHRVVIRSLTC